MHFPSPFYFIPFPYSSPSLSPWLLASPTEAAGNARRNDKQAKSVLSASSGKAVQVAHTWPRGRCCYNK